MTGTMAWAAMDVHARSTYAASLDVVAGELTRQRFDTGRSPRPARSTRGGSWSRPLGTMPVRPASGGRCTSARKGCPTTSCVENFVRRLPTRAHFHQPPNGSNEGSMNAAHLTDLPPYE